MGRGDGQVYRHPAGASGGRCLRGQGRVRLARVDSLLEAPADLLAGRQEVVARAARRKLQHPDGLVSIAVAARIGGCLVERPQAVDLPPEGHERSTTSDRARWEPAAAGGSRSLRTKSRSASAPRLARPRAPVAPRADEVPVRGPRLLERGPTVAEELPLTRAHLEEAAVLTVLGVRPVPGLTAGDLERLSAVGPEDVADCLRGRALELLPQPPLLGCSGPSYKRDARASGPRLRAREVPARRSETKLRPPSRSVGRREASGDSRRSGSPRCPASWSSCDARAACRDRPWSSRARPPVWRRERGRTGP